MPPLIISLPLLCPQCRKSWRRRWAEEVYCNVILNELYNKVRIEKVSHRTGVEVLDFRSELLFVLGSSTGGFKISMIFFQIVALMLQITFPMTVTIFVGRIGEIELAGTGLALTVGRYNIIEKANILGR